MSRTPPRILSHLPLALLGRVREAFPELEILEVPGKGPVPEGLRGEVLLTQTWASPNIEEVLDCGVEWVHAYGTGVNRFPFEALGGRPFTCSRGASAVPIAEWVLAVMLAFEKRLPESWISEPPERWNLATLGGLQGRTLALVGLGGIGLAIAERALAFGMQVRAMRRRPEPSPLPGVVLVSSLEELLADAHHLVVAAPATPRTHHLVDREAFALLPPGAHLVNIARGDLVDQDALREALDSGHLALASLDTVTPEPLPEGHWLYTHPGVRLSPHVSWSMPGAMDGLVDPFIENLGRWQEGLPLIDQVGVEEGY